MNFETQKILDYDKILSMLQNETSTFLGKKLAASLTPSNEYNKALELLNETKEAVLILEEKEPSFAGIYYLDEYLKSVSIGKKLELEDFIKILDTLHNTRRIKIFFEHIDFDTQYLKNYIDKIEPLDQLEKALEKVFDEHGIMRDDASKNLKIIKNKIKSNRIRIKKTLDALIHSSEIQKYLQDNIITIRSDRYVLPIKKEYKNVFQGIVHDQSSTGSTFYIEPMIIFELNNHLKELALAERREIDNILHNLSLQINNNRITLQNNLDALANLDFIFAKAKLARKQLATYPILNENNTTILKKARHPLIPIEKIVPIDISIGTSYKMLLITGPNAGGKTISLKTLGLLAMMAKSGLFLPTEIDSEIAFYQNIYANIGDEQSLEQNLSTFSAHITSIIELLKTVNDKDLLLLDEIGNGTSPEEGAALAISILEEFLKKNITIMATTHYSELKAFAYERSDIENASVEFDINTLSPTYNLLIGVLGTSNAFAISQKLGLDEKIINRAKSLIQKEYLYVENIINKLESEHATYEKLNVDIRKKRDTISILENNLKLEKQVLNEKKSSFILRAQDESNAIIRKAKIEVEEIIKNLKLQYDDYGIKQRQDAIKKARDQLRSLANNIVPVSVNPKNDNIPIDLNTIAIGDTVFIKSLSQKAIVLNIIGKNLKLQVGNLKTIIPAENCTFVTKNKDLQKLNIIKSNMILQKTTNITREIDIRGMMVDEGIILIEKFIDDTLLAGFKQFLIIHGKGTGALRKGIHTFLKNNNHIATFNFADITEGGSGATIVKLK